MEVEVEAADAVQAVAAAVGVGLAWALPGELLVTAAWSDGARWLPGQLLDTLAQGDTTAVIVEGAVALHEVRSGRRS